MALLLPPYVEREGVERLIIMELELLPEVPVLYLLVCVVFQSEVLLTAPVLVCVSTILEFLFVEVADALFEDIVFRVFTERETASLLMFRSLVLFLLT